MSLVQPTQPSTVLVAIDIAELRHDVLIEASGMEEPQTPYPCPTPPLSSDGLPIFFMA